MKYKKEYRYQFLGYEEIETGKYKKPLGGLGIGSLQGSLASDIKFPITKTVAMVFDKQTGIVKQVDIKKLKRFNVD